MKKRHHNPFSSMNLISPTTQRDDYNRYCQTATTTSPDNSPFPRKVDMWIAGLSIAARQKIPPIELTKEDTVDIINGSIFSTDSWQIQLVMLVSIAIEGTVDVVLNPRRMMDIANGLAAAGVPIIIEMLNNGGQNPLQNLSNALDDLFRSDTLNEEETDVMRISSVLR